MRIFRSRLASDTKGAALVEFAMVAPIFLTMLMGIFDVAHTLYTTSILQGTMQKAGRDFTLENAGSRTDELNAFVNARIRQVAPSAEVTFERKSYYDFSDVEQAERWTDEDDDGECNNGEVFEDANGNGQWDADRGADGNGGARDAVLYTATITYPRLFPMAGLIGLNENVTLEGSTVLRNQPFDQQDRTIATGNCE
jgi:hypothetical protein